MLIVNRVQRHNCTYKYCERFNRVTKTRQCRFHYPRPLYPYEAIITRAINASHDMYDSPRNDDRMNQWNRLNSLGWMGNTDITLCTNIGATVNYLAKYVSKQEVPTESFTQIATKVLPKVSHVNLMVSFTAKMLNQLVGERDVGAQEVCYVLLKLPMTNSTRTIISFDCREPGDQRTALRFDQTSGQMVPFGQSSLQKYMGRVSRFTEVNKDDEHDEQHMERLQEVIDCTLYDWLIRWDFALLRPRP